MVRVNLPRALGQLAEGVLEEHLHVHQLELEGDAVLLALQVAHLVRVRARVRA